MSGYNCYFLTCIQISQEEGKVKRSESHSAVSDSLQPHGLYSLWNSLGQNTRVGSLSLLQGIFPTQGLNLGLPHCRQILYQLSHQGSPGQVRWSGIPISLRIFQFVVIHTVKGFSVVNKEETDVFLEFSCFFLWSNGCWQFDLWIKLATAMPDGNNYNSWFTTYYQHCSMYDSLFNLFYLSLKTQGTPWIHHPSQEPACRLSYLSVDIFLFLSLPSKGRLNGQTWIKDDQ